MTPQELEAKFSEFNFYVCVDASGSMSKADCPGGRTRWAYMRETVGALARELGKIDSDGIGLITFGGDVQAQDGVTADLVEQVFDTRRPMGDTPMHTALEEALKLAAKSDKKAFILVATDGVPNDEEAVTSVIRKAATKAKTEDDVTFLFVQVGRDTEASQYLGKLDTGLNTKFDIVCCLPIEVAEKFASTVEMIQYAIDN